MVIKNGDQFPYIHGKKHQDSNIESRISNPYAKQCIMFRAVANVSSCRVYVIGRRGSVQEGSSSGSIFLFFPMKVAGVHAHSSQGNPQPPALSDSPECYLPHSWARKYKNPRYTCIFSRPFFFPSDVIRCYKIYSSCIDLGHDFHYNPNYNLILKCDWAPAVLILALIGHLFFVHDWLDSAHNRKHTKLNLV